MKFRTFLLLTALALFAFSCDQTDDDDQMQEELENIVVTAQDTDALSNLVAALVSADENEDSDLIGTLSGEGPFTVFAPTNDAFADLLSALDGFDSLEDFDTEEEKTILATILQYHVIAGVAAASTDLTEGQELTTVQGEILTVSLEGGVFINDATDEDAEVVIPDVMASNGIVHVIDKVLVPQAILDALAGDDDDEDDDDDEEESKNIVEIAQETDDLSILVDALVAANAGLVETLSGDGPFTVFAPTNEAFVELLNALGDDYNSLADFDTQEEIDLLIAILTYHVVAGTEAFSTDLSDGQTIGTVNGGEVTIKIDGNGVAVKDATDDLAHVDLADVDASNGVVHVIDKVLLPQEALDFLAAMQMKNIVELAIETDDLSILVDALVAADAGLVETLSGEGPFTVFAPTNDAFVELLNALGEDYNSLADFDTEEEIDLLVAILTYHVVAGVEAFSTDLSDGQTVPTVNGGELTIKIDGNGVAVKDVTDDLAHVDVADVDASNGVVHIIDKVLLPQEAIDFLTMAQMKTIVEIAVETDDLSILVDALVQADAGLVEALGGDGPFTVFAPTNAAFAELLNILGNDFNSIGDFDTEAEKELLTKVLLYHVVSGAFFKEDFNEVNSVTTLQGENIGVNIRNTGVINLEDFSNDHTQVIMEDVEAKNGVVHIVNKVLLPQEVIDAL